MLPLLLFSFFFFNDPATTEIYTLSLHDALPISEVDRASTWRRFWSVTLPMVMPFLMLAVLLDRKSTRLNSSHEWISYAVFCLKKKKKKKKTIIYEIQSLLMSQIMILNHRCMDSS